MLSWLTDVAETIEKTLGTFAVWAFMTFTITSIMIGFVLIVVFISTLFGPTATLFAFLTIIFLTPITIASVALYKKRKIE